MICFQYDFITKQTSNSKNLNHKVENQNNAISFFQFMMLCIVNLY